MNKLVTLQQYFATGTAEGDAPILADAFVVPKDYYDIIQPPLGSPRLLVGKKGSGKSAVLEMIRVFSERESIPALLLRPDDVLTEAAPSARDIGTLKKHALASLVEAVAAKLGSGMNGWISEADAQLFRAATQRGVKSPDRIQKVLKLLLPLGKATTSVDFQKLLPASVDTNNLRHLLGAVQANMARTEKLLFLLIDDTDQIAAPDVPDHLNRIWAFLLATRSLCGSLPDIRCIVTIRSEVWTRLQSERGGQRDQIDHFRLLAKQYNPTDKHIADIFARRVELAWKQIGSPPGNPLVPFFKSESVNLPRSDETRSWPDYLVKSSRERPRDLIQFVGELIANALNVHEETISSDTVARCSTRFSEERVQDLALEVERDCPQLRSVVESFSKLDWDIQGVTVQEHLAKLPSAFSIAVRGLTLQPDNRDHILLLWGLLFEVGFLNPRWPDSRESKGYRHGSFREEPHLVSLSELHRLRTTDWEVHPAYRSYLMKQREDEVARTGVPSRRRR